MIKITKNCLITYNLLIYLYNFDFVVSQWIWTRVRQLGVRRHRSQRWTRRWSRVQGSHDAERTVSWIQMDVRYIAKLCYLSRHSCYWWSHNHFDLPSLYEQMFTTDITHSIGSWLFTASIQRIGHCSDISVKSRRKRPCDVQIMLTYISMGNPPLVLSLISLDWSSVYF